jgi:hypothetical protein
MGRCSSKIRGAHATRVLVVETRDNELFRSAFHVGKAYFRKVNKSSRWRVASANTRVACAPRIREGALDRPGCASDQSSFAKITEIPVRRALDQIDREFEQANLPGFVYALNDSAERFLEMLHF